MRWFYLFQHGWPVKIHLKEVTVWREYRDVSDTTYIFVNIQLYVTWRAKQPIQTERIEILVDGSTKGIVPYICSDNSLQGKAEVSGYVSTKVIQQYHYPMLGKVTPQRIDVTIVVEAAGKQCTARQKDITILESNPFGPI